MRDERWKIKDEQNDWWNSDASVENRVWSRKTEGESRGGSREEQETRNVGEIENVMEDRQRDWWRSGYEMKVEALRKLPEPPSYFPSPSSRINVLSWIIAASYEFLSIIDHRWNPFRRRNKEIDFLHWMASYCSFYYISIYLIENRIENIEWIKRLYW